ncbi:MAG: aldo/keto reductase [Synergistaceae bacterium]|nr:aldo/keto reductase [Synergistaceae bacterium]
MEHFTLANGLQIPALGYGTGIANGISRHPLRLIKRAVKETVKRIVSPGFARNNHYTLAKDFRKDRMLKKTALAFAEHGGRMFDTSRAYQLSESYLCEAFRNWQGRFRRSDFFIITKVTNRAQRAKTVMEDFETSLRNLGTDYVDLYLLHWPQEGAYLDSWKVLEEIYSSGKAKAIGVCNCHVHHLEAIREIAQVMPMADELECHPLLQQHEVRNYCREHNIQLIAHTPTGKMGSAGSPVLKDIAGKYGVKVSQVILRWHYQLGDVSIPNTTNPVHAAENLDIWGFALSDDDMLRISGLDSGQRIWPDPDNCDFSRL